MSSLQLALQLIRPSVQFKESFLASFRELETDMDRFAWNYLGESVPLDTPAKDFDAYVQRLLDRERITPPGFVCDTVYWAIVDSEVVGRISIRHELNEMLSKAGGHIGYIVRPSWRRKGIASAMLAKLLQTERARAIGRLLITCDEGNVASEKTIVNNGGVFESYYVIGPDRPRKKRFWVTLTGE